MEHQFSLTFKGIEADQNRLSAYDASISSYGMTRVISLIGHYYQTGNIIQHAPKSAVEIYIYPPEEGSFKQNLAAAVVGGVIAAPFGAFFSKVMDNWMPSPEPHMAQILQEMKTKNELIKEQNSILEDQNLIARKQNALIEEHIEQNEDKILLLRGITANSLKDTFRPIGRSARHVELTVSETKEPVFAADLNTVRKIESERLNEEISVIHGVVNGFTRSTKRGTITIGELRRSIPFELYDKSIMNRGDDFSWSQYTGAMLQVTGYYVYWFDGRIKRFIVHDWERVDE